MEDTCSALRLRTNRKMTLYHLKFDGQKKMLKPHTADTKFDLINVWAREKGKNEKHKKSYVKIGLKTCGYLIAIKYSKLVKPKSHSITTL